MNPLRPLLTANPSNVDEDGWSQDVLGMSDFSPAQGIVAAGSGASGMAGSPGMTDVLFLTEAGDAASISVNDIHQGSIGDCFLLAAVGELALTDPGRIRNMIHTNADGTETVSLYGHGSTSTLKPQLITVNNDFSGGCANCGSGQDQVGDQKEIWVQVLEKALATLNGGYSAISNGGSPGLIMEELTGHSARSMSPAEATASLLTSMARDGSMVVFDTAGRSNLSYSLVSNHAYMFEGMTTVGGVAAVKLGNPWGYNQPAAIPVSKLSQQFSEVLVGHW